MIEKLSPEARTFLSDFLNQIDYEKDKKIERLESIISGLDNTIENLEEVVEHKENIIKEVREMLYKRDKDDYDTYTANVLCDIQSDFEEILREEY